MAVFWWFIRVPNDIIFDTGEMTIHGHKITLELAQTPPQWQRGLMHRRYMPSNHGMLFIYDTARQINMWMKNTYIPLDIIFMDQHQKITRIVTDTKPLSEIKIRSFGNVKYVLELKAGVSKKLGLQVGETFIW